MTKPKYPIAPRSEVADTYHGTGVPDPYRWLEDPEDPFLQEVTRTFGVKNWKVKELIAEGADSKNPGETVAEE